MPGLQLGHLVFVFLEVLGARASASRASGLLPCPSVLIFIISFCRASSAALNSLLDDLELFVALEDGVDVDGADHGRDRGAADVRRRSALAVFRTAPSLLAKRRTDQESQPDQPNPIAKIPRVETTIGTTPFLPWRSSAGAMSPSLGSSAASTVQPETGEPSTRPHRRGARRRFAMRSESISAGGGPKSRDGKPIPRQIALRRMATRGILHRSADGSSRTDKFVNRGWNTVPLADQRRALDEPAATSDRRPGTAAGVRRTRLLLRPKPIQAQLSFSLARVAQDEVVEAVLLVPGSFAGRGEEAEEHLAEVIGAHAVEVVLAFAARLDEPGNPQAGPGDGSPRAGSGPAGDTGR